MNTYATFKVGETQACQTDFFFFQPPPKLAHCAGNPFDAVHMMGFACSRTVRIEEIRQSVVCVGIPQ